MITPDDDAQNARNDTSGVVRVTTNLPGPAVEQLRANAALKGDNLTQGLKAAISTKLVLDQAVTEGGKVYIKQKDGSMVELVLP